MHYVSPSALAYITENLGNSKVKSKLVKDHCVPMETLFEIVIQAADDPLTALERFYRVGLITDVEHQRINKDYKSAMPENWYPDENADLMIRYNNGNYRLGANAITDLDWNNLVDRCREAQRSRKKVRMGQ